MEPQKKMEDDLKKKWKMNQSTKINLIGCDTIVNSPSKLFYVYRIICRKHVFWKSKGKICCSKLIPATTPLGAGITIHSQVHSGAWDNLNT